MLTSDLTLICSNVYKLNFPHNTSKMELQPLAPIEENMSESEQNEMLREIIQGGDVGALDTFMQEQGDNLDLSRFPGEPGWTPLAHSVLHQRKNVFRFLLDMGVDLQVPILVPTLLPHAEAGLVHSRNILSFCVMAHPNRINFFDYAEILCEKGVEICTPGMDLAVQPLWVLSWQVEDIIVTQRRLALLRGTTDAWQIEYTTATSLLNMMVVQEVRRNQREGAELLMHIFCDRNVFSNIFRPRNLLGKLLLQLIEDGEDINIELYDLRRFFFDDTTKKIYARLQRNQNELNLVFRSMAPPYNKSNSLFSNLPSDLRSKILEQLVPENLRALEREECVRCFNTRNLHEVCQGGHKLCATCYVEWVQLGNNCPVCRRRMHGT